MVADSRKIEAFQAGVKVLDHGYVKLVDYMGSDEFIVESARMSTSKGFEGWEPHKGCKQCGLAFERWQHHDDGYSDLVCTDGKKDHEWVDKAGDAKMLDFMYKNRHATPFEFGQLVIEVQAPIMVFREMPDLHYLPTPERVQKQSMSNKQGSGEALRPEDAADVIDTFRQEQAAVYGIYDAFVRRGLAKEIARIDTPVSRYSRMRASADLRCWLAFLLLRRAPAAQWEIRQYADVVGQIVAAVWPRVYALFEEYDFFGTNLSRTEGKKLHKALMLIDSSVLKEIGLLDLVKRLESIQ